jgi:four helix bundle protein
MHQLVKSATSVGANTREASHAMTRREFIHKIGIAQKECAETHYWLELCRDTSTGDRRQIERLANESSEILAILVTIARKARRNLPGA